MESTIVKTVIQEAFNEFKDQFDEFITDEKRKLFLNLFKVNVDVYGNVHVDDIYLGINIKDCGDSFSYKVDVERICIFLNTYKTIIIDLDWANNRDIPNIKNIALRTKIYSSGNE